MDAYIPEWRPTTCLFKKTHVFQWRKDGKKNIIFDQTPLADWQQKLTIQLPCKRCLYCQLHYSLLWASRCVKEAENYPNNNCFVTLTYNEENMPKDGFLCKRDYQLFIKKLRKRYPGVEIRYFLAGEYTRDNHRPHFHITFFNYKPDDLVLFKEDDGTLLYTSKEINQLWGKGFISVGTDISVRTIKYVAKYMSKMLPLPQKYNKHPEFIQASTNPGIGYNQYDTKYFDDHGIYVNGKRQAIPEYYFKIAEKRGGADLEKLNAHKAWTMKRTKDNALSYDEEKKQIYNYLKKCQEKDIPFSHMFDLRRQDLKEDYDIILKRIQYGGFNPNIKN